MGKHTRVGILEYPCSSDSGALEVDILEEKQLGQWQFINCFFYALFMACWTNFDEDTPPAKN